ncbi:killer cell lectin-like receptor subfamily F member 1 [Tenrec ecaudatus]|uniref:killer cell lectin-like receptor subfamily F member 1 n=1 Tax=Tenrec ecaudatus TaxID=94439 RepID=UPI003F59CD74
MLDEDGYMTLHVQPKKRGSGQTSQLKSKEYTMNFIPYKTLLGLSGIINCILALTLITLIFLVSQGVLLKCQYGNSSRLTPQEEFGNLKVNSKVRRNISCKATDPYISRATRPTDFCSAEWVKYQEKYYWFSNELKNWSNSYKHCLGKKSQLLIIQDQLEMDFIQKYMMQPNYVWIGLHITTPKKSWTWVDGSPLDQKLFSIKGPAKENSCGAIKKHKLHSETCSSFFKWVCQYQDF